MERRPDVYSQTDESDWNAQCNRFENERHLLECLFIIERRIRCRQGAYLGDDYTRTNMPNVLKRDVSVVKDVRSQYIVEEERVV